MFDPVCGMETESEKIKASYLDSSYFFCSEACKNDFQENPKTYIEKAPVILMENVWKVFSLGAVEVSVLRGLSMYIHDGELVALVGPSGSGKSTALNIMGTLDVPTKGKIEISGKDTIKMNENELADLRSKKIGFIFQQFNLIPSLSAIENVMLPQLLRGNVNQEIQDRALSLLESVGLKDRAKHKPMELSGGEQQRVAIARAFINDPEIIFADEPTGNLDSTTSAMIIELLVNLWREKKKTIIIITHDPHVAAHAQRIINFKDGKQTRNHEITKKALWKEKHHNGN